MRLCTRILLSLGALLAAPAALAQLQLPEAGPAYQVDRGFAALGRRLAAGLPVEVTYLGGSVTKGGSTHPRIGVGPNGPYDYSNYEENQHSWRARSFAQLAAALETYSGQLVQNSCGLGGTGSELANYRFDWNVGATDLLVCEFAINDRQLLDTTAQGLDADRSIYRSLQGILNQARAANPNVAILTVLPPLRDFPTSTTVQRANYARSRAASMHFQASRRLPTVDVVEAFYWSTIPAGYDPLRLFDGGYSPGNELHPSPSGHAYMAEVVAARVVDLVADPRVAFPAVPPIPSDLLPFPVSPQVLEPLELDALSSTDGWNARINEENWATYPFYAGRLALFADGAGSLLQVPFEGTSVGLWWEWHFTVDNIAGRVEVILDGQSLGIWSDLGGSDQPFRRFIHLRNGLDPDVPHLLELHVLPYGAGPIQLALHGIALDR